jgi:hypothetical protein
MITAIIKGSREIAEAEIVKRGLELAARPVETTLNGKVKNPETHAKLVQTDAALSACAAWMCEPSEVISGFGYANGSLLWYGAEKNSE